MATNGSAYPRSECNIRPYRLWDSNKKQAVRWRYYSDLRRAHMGALYEVRWGKIGTTIEVYNAHNTRCLGVYILRVNDIAFFGNRGDAVAFLAKTEPNPFITPQE